MGPIFVRSTLLQLKQMSKFRQKCTYSSYLKLILLNRSHILFYSGGELFFHGLLIVPGRLIGCMPLSRKSLWLSRTLVRISNPGDCLFHGRFILSWKYNKTVFQHLTLAFISILDGRIF
jgi:hypothetical protein